MLEENIYKTLDKLPKIPNTKPYSELFFENISERRRIQLSRINKIQFAKIKFIPKVITIVDAKLENYRAFFKNAYFIKPSDSLKFKVKYEYTGNIPKMIVIQQSIDEVTETMNVLFMPKSTYELEVAKSFVDPGNITCKAITRPRLEFPLKFLIDLIREYNSLSQVYSIGLFDDRYKPVDEYPVQGVDNAILDIPYSWGIENKVYPLPLPNGLIFDNLSVNFVSGFINYENKFYKDPETNNTVRITARIINNTGYTLNVQNYGLVLSTLYEDNRHVSQAIIDISFPSFTMYNGTTYNYSLDINLPTWAYGKIAIAHAINFFRNGILFYTGGPFFCFEAFRLRFPS